MRRDDTDDDYDDDDDDDGDDDDDDGDDDDGDDDEDGGGDEARRYVSFGVTECSVVSSEYTPPHADPAFAPAPSSSI